jgi:serine/threonine protein kinase
MKIWSILQWWNVCLVLCHRICWREWSELYIISANWYIIICYYFSFCLILSCAFSVDMQRSLLEGVDWTGQRELLQEKVSKLFWSYLDSRFVFFLISLCFCEISYCWGFCFYFVLFSRSLVCICFFWQNLVMQHVDHSAGDLIHLLQGLLRYDPMDRLTAREALRHPFFAKDHRRIWGMDWLLIVCWNCCCKQRGHKSQDIWMCCSKLLTQSKSVQYGNLLRMINRMLICKQPV